MCTLDDPKLHEVKDYRDWAQPSLPRNVSDEIHHLFRRMTRLEAKLRPTASNLLDEIVFINRESQVIEIKSFLNDFVVEI